MIRIIISLSSLDNKYFVSADVCGIIRVWPSSIQPKIDTKQSEKSLSEQNYKANTGAEMVHQGHLIQINLNDAISYNSLIELRNIYTNKKTRFNVDDTALIAVALKSAKIYIIMIAPNAPEQPEAKKPPSFNDFSKENHQENSSFFILQKIQLEMKPTCMI